MALTTPVGGVWALKSGDFVPTNFASTQSGLQAALDYLGTDGGECYVAAGTITGITNLKVYGNCILRGSPFAPTILERSASATGPCIREYTFGEGNSRGATHIIIRDLMIKGNGSTGNGLDLGNGLIGDGTDTYTLNANAGFHHITVRDFVGDGINVCANTVMMCDIHTPANTVGIRYRSGGGVNRTYGLWAEGNTSENIIVEGGNNTFFGVHTEETQAGSQAAIKCTAGQNAFFDVDMYLTQNRTDLITLAAGVSGIYLENITVRVPGAATWTNTFRHLTYGTGTGAEYRMSLRDTRPGGYGKVIWWNSSTNAMSSVESAIIAANALTVATTANVTGATTLSTLRTTSTSQMDGNVTVGVAGASSVVQVGQGAADAFSSVCRVRSGDTGGAESSFEMNQNGVIKGRLFYNGSSTFLDATGSFIIRNGSGGAEIARVGSTGDITGQRRYLAGGTALVAGDFALSAGWGTTASVGTITGTDTRCRFTVTSAGTGQAANPTITLTFKDGTYPGTPFAIVARAGGSQPAVLPTWTKTATTLVITFPGTPVAAETYTFESLVVG